MVRPAQDRTGKDGLRTTNGPRVLDQKHKAASEEGSSNLNAQIKGIPITATVDEYNLRKGGWESAFQFLEKKQSK